MPNSLFVSKGQNQGRKYILTDADILIGRDSSNYVCIPEIKVSRRHCRISCVEGEYFLDDLESANGTFVNGVRVSRCLLSLGDLIQIGSNEMIFEDLSNVATNGTQPDAGHSDGRELKSHDSLQPDPIVAAMQAMEESHATNRASSLSSKINPASLSSVQLPQTPETLIDPISGTPASRLDEESAYYDRVADVREASRRFIQVGNDLRFIYHASLATSRSSDRERMLDEILVLIFDWIAADRGCVFLKNDEVDSFDMTCFKCRVELESFDFRPSKTIMSYVRQKKVGVLSARASKDERWGAQPSILKMKTGEVLCVPIQGRDDLLGMIYLDTLVGAGGDEYQRFNEDNLKLLIAMAHQAAVAIENEAYYAALLEKERLAAIGETTGVIAHHVKNMLQGVNGGAHLIESGLRMGNMDVIGKGWQIVSRNQDQVSRLVIDMLMLARPYTANRKTADINEAVEEAIAELRFQFKSQTTICEFNPNEIVLPFSFDRAAMVSAVLHIVNLCLLTCRSNDEGRIVIQVGYRRGDVVIIIHDNGERIEVSETNDVLDPFGFGEDQKIYGIGLAVSRKIVAGHGGRLLLSHPDGVGNRFLIELPQSV